MGQKSGPVKKPAEQVVREIRRRKPIGFQDNPATTLRNSRRLTLSE
jgi:hypothetical protein